MQSFGDNAFKLEEQPLEGAFDFAHYKGDPSFPPIDIFLAGNLHFLELAEFDNVKITKFIKTAR
ncbi:MAG: hypothetical protein VB078_05245 [Clostridiaceae bacterium]|nr:hypothetical protein [Clostridiaceae bacterium]